MKKTLILIFILFSISVFAEKPPAEKARGLFVAVGVGPRIPVGNFSNSTDLGYGLNLEFSYTDNEYLPFFVFLRAGYERYSGSQDFYKTSDYSNLSVKSFPINFGVRYYFPPLLENVILLMPVVELSAAVNIFDKLHEFKPSTGKNNFTEKNSKLGVSAGVGFSMFLIDIFATYNYFQTNQYVGLDLKVRLPLFITF